MKTSSTVLLALVVFLALGACSTLDDLLKPPGDKEPEPGDAVADLTVVMFSTNPAQVTRGDESIDLSIVVGNIGSKPSPVTQLTVSLEGRLWNEATPFEPPDVITKYIPAIDYGGTYTSLANIRVPGGVPFGSYEVVIHVDPDHAVPQLDRTNDVLRVSFEVEYPCTNPSAAVSFADSTLANRIAETLGIAGGSISCGALQELTHLDIGYNAVRSFGGLELAHSLRSLAMHDSGVGDLSLLSQLPALRELNFSGGTAVYALPDLPNLNLLNVSGSGLTDVEFVSRLPGLTRLFMADNAVVDLQPLRSLPLRQLDISSNPVQSGDDLSDMDVLRELYASDTAIADWSFLSRMPALRYLDVSANPGLDQAALDSLPASLFGLYVRQQGLRDLGFLRRLNNLSFLHLGDNSIDDISVLAGLPWLNSLILYGNLLTDISPLLAMPWSIEGSWVDVSDNCLDLSVGSPAQAAVRELEGRGVTVYSEPQFECGPAGAAGAWSAVFGVQA